MVRVGASLDRDRIAYLLHEGWIAMVQCYRSLRQLGLDGEGRMRLFSGPRPDDQGELRAWKWGWHFMYAFLAVLISMIAFAVTAWLTGN